MHKWRPTSRGNHIQWQSLWMPSLLTGRSFFFYAFPPFCLISRRVQKIIQDQATGILIIPEVDYSAILYSCAGPSDRHTTSSRGFCSESCFIQLWPVLIHYITDWSYWYTNYQSFLAKVRVFARHCRDYHAFLER